MSLIPSRKIVVLSGGTAANSLVDVFNDLIEKNHYSLSYVIPISDNGGSSSELIRVFGGPGIGDIRSITLCFYVLCFSIVYPPYSLRSKSVSPHNMGTTQALYRIFLSSPQSSSICFHFHFH